MTLFKKFREFTLNGIVEKYIVIIFKNIFIFETNEISLNGKIMCNHFGKYCAKRTLFVNDVILNFI